MKLIGKVHGARVCKTSHGRFRTFIHDKALLGNSQSGKYTVIYDNPWDEGIFIHRVFQWC